MNNPVPANPLDRPQRSHEELKDAVIEINNRIALLKQTKKSIVSDYNTQIKDQELELEALLAQLKADGASDA